jgi:hypothetical protein
VTKSATIPPGKVVQTLPIQSRPDRRAWARFQTATDVWANRELSVNGQRITVTLPPRDGAVIGLR